MRRLACHLAIGLLSLGALISLGALTARADAQLQCLSPSQRGVFDVQALRSELMVLATGCGDDQRYNAFIERYKPQLLENEDEISSWFQHRYGRRGRKAHDTFVTELANAQASRASRLGSEFCPRNGMIFHQAMALQSGRQLTSFAAGQALLPRSMGICPEQVAQASPRRPATHHRAARHRATHHR